MMPVFRDYVRRSNRSFSRGIVLVPECQGAAFGLELPELLGWRGPRRRTLQEVTGATVDFRTLLALAAAP